uniref:GNAT family N-acetyltransferase n=1 Tax=Streptomyces europaeiscabiei TaxID=146819 RepID=UPI0038F6696B
DVRGQGIGRQLFEAFCQAIRRDQYKKILLHVLSSNPEACLFYEKLGFKEEAVLKNQFYLNGHSVDDLIYSYYLEDNHAT